MARAEEAQQSHDEGKESLGLAYAEGPQQRLSLMGLQ